MGSHNNADQQFQKSSQAIQGNTQQTVNNLKNWIAQNQFPVSGANAPMAPGQMNRVFGGQAFGGAQGNQMNAGQGVLPSPITIPGVQQQNSTAPIVGMRQEGQPAPAPTPMQPGPQFGPNQHNLIALLRQHGLIR